MNKKYTYYNIEKNNIDKFFFNAEENTKKGLKYKKMGLDYSKPVIGEPVDENRNEIVIRLRSPEQFLEICSSLALSGVKPTAVSESPDKTLIWIKQSDAAALCDASCSVETLPCAFAPKGTHKVVFHGRTHVELLMQKRQLEDQGYEVSATSSPTELGEKTLYLTYK